MTEMTEILGDGWAALEVAIILIGLAFFSITCLGIVTAKTRKVKDESGTEKSIPMTAKYKTIAILCTSLLTVVATFWAIRIITAVIGGLLYR